MFISGLFAYIITSLWGESTTSLRISTVIQNIFFFITPSIAIALFITKLPADFLQLRKLPSLKSILLTILILIFSIPTMNFIIHCNESVVFPDALSGLENSLKALEESNRTQIKILLGEPTIGSLIMSILIIGLLTGLGEELFFRGALQNIFRTRPMNPHYAIWITAVIIRVNGEDGKKYFAHTLNNSLVVISSWISSRNTINFDINKIATDFSSESYVLIFISITTTSLLIIQLYRHYRTISHS